MACGLSYMHSLSSIVLKHIVVYVLALAQCPGASSMFQELEREQVSQNNVKSV